MSDCNFELENILRADSLSGDDDIPFKDYELETLLNCPDVGVDIIETAKLPLIPPHLHDCPEELYSRKGTSDSIDHICSITDGVNDYSLDDQKGSVGRSDDSYCEEDGCEMALSLSTILSESNDEDFDLEIICRDESGVFMESSSLGTSASCITDMERRQNIGPLNFLSPSEKIASYPIKTYAYISLDEIASRVAFSSIITAVFINLSSICIGTSKGCVALYSHDDKRILKTLNHSDLSTGVTGIGVYNVRNCLVCGYDVGIIAIWDIQDTALDNTLLMFIDDLHFFPLRFLNVIYRSGQKNLNDSDRFVSFVSSDDSGATYRVCIMKSIFTKYSYESECLLPSKVKSTSILEDKSSPKEKEKKGSRIGDIMSLAVLPSPSPTIPPPLDVLLKMELMAFSTQISTFIVQLRPKVLILHKWSIASTSTSTPAASVPQIRSEEEKEKEKEIEEEKKDEREKEGEQKEKKEKGRAAASDTNSESEKSVQAVVNHSHEPVSTLDWTWSKQNTPLHPLLLRTSDTCIQVLSLTPSGEIDIPGSSDKKLNVFTFEASQSTVDASVIFAAKWVNGTEISVAAITDFNLLIYSYPGFILTEKIPLLPDMTAALSVTNRYNRMVNTKHSDINSSRSFINHDIRLYFQVYKDDFYFFPLAMTGKMDSNSNQSASLSPAPLFSLPSCFYRIERTGKTQCAYENTVLCLTQQGKWLEALGLCIQSQYQPISEPQLEINDVSIHHVNGATTTPPTTPAPPHTPLHTHTTTSKVCSEKIPRTSTIEEISFFESMIKKYTMIAVYKHSFFIANELKDRNGKERKYGFMSGNNGFNNLNIKTKQSNSHYQLAARVCIQFCVELHLIDTLFNEIYEMFQISGQETVFLKTVACQMATMKPVHSLLQTLPLHIISSMERIAEETSTSTSTSIGKLTSELDFILLEKCILTLDMTAQEILYGSHGLSDMMLKHDLFLGFLHSYSSANHDFADAFRLAFKHYESKYSVRVRDGALNSGLQEYSFEEPSSEEPSTPYSLSLSCPNIYQNSSFSSSTSTTSPRYQFSDNTAGCKLLMFVEKSLSNKIVPKGLGPETTSVSSHHVLELLEEVILHTPVITSTTTPRTMSNATSTYTLTSTSTSSYGDVQIPGKDCVDYVRYKYLEALSQIDSRRLLHCLAVGIRNVATTQTTEIISQLYISLFKFVNEYDMKNRKNMKNKNDTTEEVNDTKFMKSNHLLMTECFFFNFESDLLLHTSSLLPLDLILSLLLHFSQSNINKKQTSSTVHTHINSRNSSRVEDLVCHVILTEISHVVPTGNSERKDALLQCLEECNFWRPAILLSSGYSVALKDEIHKFDEESFNRAMQYYTVSSSSSSSSSSPISLSSSSSSSSFSSTVSSTPSTKNKHLELFYYLKFCNLIVVEEDELTLQMLRLSCENTVDWLPVYGFFPIHDDRINDNSQNFKIFKNCLMRYLAVLSSIDLVEMKNAACALFLNDDVLLISATECSRRIQFELLSALLNHILDSRQAAILEGGDLISLPVITPNTFMIYVTLLIVERPSMLFSYLMRCRKCSHHIPVDECLLLCNDALKSSSPIPIPVATLDPVPVPAPAPIQHTQHQHQHQHEVLNDFKKEEVTCQWILLDSISLLKEMKLDVIGALSAIIEFISYASKEEKNQDKNQERNQEKIMNMNEDKKVEIIDRIMINKSIIKNEECVGGGERLIHGVQSLVRLCIFESKEDKERKENKENKDNKDNKNNKNIKNNESKERPTKQSQSQSQSQSGLPTNGLYGLWFAAMDRLLPLLGRSLSFPLSLSFYCHFH